MTITARTDAPRLDDVATEAINRRLGTVMVARPGTVESYDRSTGAAVVNLAVRSYGINEAGELQSRVEPTLVNLPVAFFAVGGYAMWADLKRGDDVLVLFCDRDISNWLLTGNADNEATDKARRFDINDAVVIPGLVPRPRALQGTAGALTVGARDPTGMRLVVTGDNKVTLGTPSAELLAETIRGLQQSAGLLADLSAGYTVLAGLPAATPLTNTNYLAAFVTLITNLPGYISNINLAITLIDSIRG